MSYKEKKLLDELSKSKLSQKETENFFWDLKLFKNFLIFICIVLLAYIIKNFYLFLILASVVSITILVSYRKYISKIIREENIIKLKLTGKVIKVFNLIMKLILLIIVILYLAKNKNIFLQNI